MDDDDKTYVDTLSDLDSGELDDTIDLPDDEDFSTELCDMTQEEDEDLGLAKVNGEVFLFHLKFLLVSLVVTLNIYLTAL